MEAIVAEAIDRFIALPQPADLSAELAYPIASRTMCHLIGVPYEDRAWFEERAEIRSVIDADPAEAAQAATDLREYVDQLIGQRVDQPRDDLISKLTHELLVPGRLTRPELVATVRLRLTAGHETTATMIGTGTFVWLTHPDQLTQIQADRTLLPAGIEELLRYVSMLHITVVRRAKNATELAGQQTSPGDGLIANPGAANKDPEAFENPDTFDIHRDARHHIAFGYWCAPVSGPAGGQAGAEFGVQRIVRPAAEPAAGDPGRAGRIQQLQPDRGAVAAGPLVAQRRTRTRYVRAHA